jgi:hypothetical protein
MSIDFNTEPYNDDYSEDKQFYRILYRPSFAVQARELTQMQTILQNQISRHGDHMFKQGAMVIPGQASIETIADTNQGTDYIKLSALYNGVAVETFLSALDGETIVGTSGVEAQIVLTQSAEGAEPSTIYVRYTNSGTDTETKTFTQGEVLSTSDGTYDFQVLNQLGSIGKGSIAKIQRGVYYVNGFFVLVPEQTIVLDKYSNTPTYRIGLNVSEEIITPESDSTLLDNAQNSYNYAAPGAHRYYIDLELGKLAIDSEEDSDFIELIRVTEGRVKTIVQTTEYNEFADELARRTYDESGDYTVREFGIDVREHRNNDRGAWTTATQYYRNDIVTSDGNTYVAQADGISAATAPTHTSGTQGDGLGGVDWQYNEYPNYNRGVYENGDRDKLAVGIEPGKAYVRGFEIEKVATTFIDVDKARTYEQTTNGQVEARVGNYILVTGVNSLPPTNDNSQSEFFGTINLYDRIPSAAGTSAGNIIGTARTRFFEQHDGDVYKLGLFDIQLVGTTNFARDVKGVGYSRGDTNRNFTAQVEPITTRLGGSVTASSTTVTGTGTSFQTDLLVGDYVLLGTTLRRVTAISSQNSITVDSSVTVTGVTIDLVTTAVLEPDYNSLVFPLPNYAVRSVRQSNGTNDTSYSVYQKFTTTATGTSLSLSTSGTFSSSANEENYIVVDNSAADGGEVLTNGVDYTVGSGGSSTITITLSASYSGHSMTVVAAVNRVGGAFEKTKTLRTSSAETFSTKAEASATTLTLNYPDVYRLVSVKMDTGTFASPTGNYDIDILERYEMDDGQRPGFYDLGSLKLKPSFAAPTAPVQVVYEYFEHGTGDYFTVNSYTNINYDEIPALLRDTIDFRPAVATKADGGDFDGASASITSIPKRGIDIETDWSYYLPRKDKIAIDFNGLIFNTKGVARLGPESPEDPALGMILYELTLEPYTFGTFDDNVNIKKTETKRYTMRDIGKLEKRIDNLEYYTSLSMLEVDTQTLDISDDNGLNRLKNGFIVDNFQGNNVGNSLSEDYQCSIDMEEGMLRPSFEAQNINLIEKNSNTSQRNAANYQLHGDIITLPIEEEPVLIEQPYASRLENINPFAIFTFLGNVTITPESDDWFETKRAPDLIQQVEGNYNVMKQLAAAQGGLGTVWNNWTTSWVGKKVTTGRETFTAANPRWGNGVWANQRALRQGATQISYNDMIRRFGGGNRAGAPARQVTVQTQAQKIGQSRTGIRTTIAVKTDYQQVADRVISTAVIPYIRSRNVLIQAKGLKPNTRFYGYFDGVPISEYCTPAKKMTYTPGSGTFDWQTNAGGQATTTSRRINGDSQVCLNKGDIITGASSGATAVVVGRTEDQDTNTYTLEIMNIVGTFTSSETITGSISGATGTVGAVTTPTTLTTNGNGDLNILFEIPNTNSLRFRTGAREFQFLDVNTADGQWTSRGRAMYRAEGILETKQATINAVRNAEIVKERVTDSRTITQTSSRVVSDTGWYDPLAQSFLVEQKGGAFVTEIDIFFATKDTKIPVSLEIRELINGTPGKTVLPFSKVTLKPEDVNISNNTVTYDDKDTAKYDTPTTFRFSTPVYLQDRGEYCFVLQSDSNNYKVWISNVGDTIPGTSRTISEQPYNGVMFKSQNASTWTPDQNQDIKFVMRRAKFETGSITNGTGTIADVEFVNDVVPYETLEQNPIQTVAGESLVRVWHYNHGMFPNSRVTIDGVTSSIGGLDAVLFNKTHTISNVDLHSYTITPDTGSPADTATASGYWGGTAVRATKNIAYNLLTPTIQMQTFSETETTYGIKSTSGKSVDGGETPYDLDGAFGSALNKEDNYYFSPRVIASEVNETNLMSSSKSLSVSVQMSTENDSLSPVIDTQRASAVAVSNLINYPLETNMNISALDEIEVFTHTDGTFSFTADGRITSTDSDVRNSMLSVGIGRYITISGATSGGNDKTVLVTDFKDDGSTGTLYTNTTFTAENSTTGTAVAVREIFIDEIAPLGSSSAAKYVTNPVKLENLSSFVRIRFGANIPYTSDIEVYYRAGVGDKEVLTDRPYVPATLTGDITKVELGDVAFYDVDYDMIDMEPFDVIEVKIVMKSTNSSAVPRLRDLRVICCA